MTQHENGYPTPDPIDPGETVCFSVFVPNSPGHIQAFKAQIEMLSYWYFWQRDEDHTGKTLAALWYTAWNSITEGCGGMIRQSPLDACIIQESDDDGVTWHDVVDMSECVSSIYPDNNPAGRPQPGEQPGGSTPDPSQCFLNTYTIPGNGHALLPYPIGEGWTIELMSYTGAWSMRNDHIYRWDCPTGAEFVLGACIDAEKTPADSTFPDPTGIQDELIVLDPDNHGHKLRPGETFVVPAGISAGNWFLQANDPDISNNDGSITATVQVCNQSAWTHTFDFTSDPSSAFVTIPGPLGVYSAGVGYQVTNYAQYRGLQLSINLPSARQLLSYSYMWSKSDCFLSPGDYSFADQVVKNFGISGQTTLQTYPCATGTDQIRELASTQNDTLNLYIDLFTYAGHGGTTPSPADAIGRITSVTLSGMGTDPFA